MNTSLLPLVAASFLLCAPLPSAQESPSFRGSFEIPSPLVSLGDTGRVATVSFDGGDYALFSFVHAEAEVLHVSDVPLPGDLRVGLTLLPTQVLEPGARAVIVAADGSRSFLQPQVKTFFGHVDGGGTVFVGVSPTMIHGYIEIGDDMFLLSSSGSPGTATIAHASLFAGDGTGSEWCGYTAPSSPSPKIDGRSMEEQGGILKLINSGSKVRTAKVFLEADQQFRNAFSSDQDCIDYVTLLTAASSSIYRRDIGSVFTIPDGYLRVWNSTPPWGTVGSFNDINNVQAWWSSNANPDRHLPRAAVHVLTRPVFGGVAFTAGGLCNNTQGYEISSLNGFFPNPVQHTSHSNWDLIVFSHEFGHTFGSGHTFNYQPPIPCFEGSGPDNGTIMSYCHLESGGNNNIGMRFHVRVQDNLIQHFGSANCLAETVIVNGDYDFDGDVDALDVAVADGILAQGFVSRAANEVFDFDGDGDFDGLDRDLLDLVVSGMPPAEVTMYNGSGLNEECYLPADPPLMGRPWLSQVLAFPAGTVSLILGYSEPIDSIFLSTGELLVHPGSAFLFSSVATSDFFFAVHEIDVPLDPSLAGAMAYVQGFRLDQACNGLQARVNFY